MNDTTASDCTCPSGDGSLRHPCPTHSIQRTQAKPAAASAGSREAAMVVIQRDAAGRPTVWCDPEIADLVTALNAGGIPTVASCSGHGEQNGIISLRDGRELIIASDYETARRYERSIFDKPAAAQEAVAIEVPAGAIYNGFAYAGRIETYGFECQAGPIANCNEWVEFRRCFSHLADWASTLPPLYTAPVAAAPVDRAALLYLMQQFDAESWQCPQCGHAEDTATMDSAHYLRHYLAENPVASTPSAPVEGGQITGWRNIDGMAVFSMKPHASILPDQDMVRYDDHLAALEAASTPASSGIDLADEVESLRWQLERANNAIATLHSSQQLRDKVAGVLDASPKGGSTDPRKLPCLPFAVFDEFGVGADDRVADYGRACATAAMQSTSHGAGVSDDQH